MANFLDYPGLQRLWTKIKNYADTAISGLSNQLGGLSDRVSNIPCYRLSSASTSIAWDAYSALPQTGAGLFVIDQIVELVLDTEDIETGSLWTNAFILEKSTGNTMVYDFNGNLWAIVDPAQEGDLQFVCNGTSGYNYFNATDDYLGAIKTNSAEGVSLNTDGQLDVAGRLGQFPDTTGLYSPKTIRPAIVKNGSLLLTEASGTSLGSKSLAVSTGSTFKLKVAAVAGATQYEVANNYANRILCANAVGGVAAVDETSAADKTVKILSVQIGGSNFTPDSSADDSSNNIIITVSESLNPDSSFAAGTNIRMYYTAADGFSNIFAGQAVGGNGGVSVVVGQRVFDKSGNACILVGADIFNQGNGNAIFGQQHISLKNRWFMVGKGHDNTNGRNEAGAAFGQFSKIVSDSMFVIGDGTNATNRSNIFEIRKHPSAGYSMLVLKAADGAEYSIYIDATGAVRTFKL